MILQGLSLIVTAQVVRYCVRPCLFDVVVYCTAGLPPVRDQLPTSWPNIDYFQHPLPVLSTGPVRIHIPNICFQGFQQIVSIHTCTSGRYLTTLFTCMMWLIPRKCATSHLPGSAVPAIVGLLTGQIYRADILGLKSYRLPLSLQTFGARFLLPLVGSVRPPRRSSLAMPDEATPRAEDNDLVTTARPRPARTSTDSGLDQGTPMTNGEPGARTSVVSQWMNELTGRGSTGGIRVPTEAEINHVTSMFPDLPRQSVVGALQRSPNIERAVETLLGSAT